MTSKILHMAQNKVYGCINQCHITMISSKAIQNNSDKVWIYYFSYINLYPNHPFSFSEWINNISLAANTGDGGYFFNHKESYFNAMPSLCKQNTVIK